VELLVVIGIIALLIAILLPALSKARMQGNWAACMSNLKQLGNAMTMYANENKGFLPRPASNGNGPYADDFVNWRKLPPNNTMYPFNDSSLAKYLNAQNDKLERIYRCPADVAADRVAQAGLAEPYRYSFSMNQDWLPFNPSTGAFVNTLTGTRHKLMQVVQSAERILLVEELNANDGRWDYPNVGTSDAVTNRHSGQGNVLWHDMHVTRLYNDDIVQHPAWTTPFK
jgi:prepilin-type processing-associated H-X9-DG protein